jgi:hypothetical protein
MLGLAKRVNARILIASTSEVYGDPEVRKQWIGCGSLSTYPFFTISIGFWGKRQFFAEIWQKSQKIVIITSTPGWGQCYDFRKIFSPKKWQKMFQVWHNVNYTKIIITLVFKESDRTRAHSIDPIFVEKHFRICLKVIKSRQQTKEETPD